MENEEQILLKVVLDEGKVAEKLQETSKSVAELRAQQAELTKQYKAGEITATEYVKKQAEVKDQLTWVQKEQKALVSSTKLLSQETKSYDDTLNGQRQKLADMQKAFAALSAEQRDSKAGKEFAKQIKEQSDAVKEMEKSIGDTSRNVGNYEEALKNAGVGIDGFKNKMKALLSNPWALLIAAIVTAVKTLIDAFKRSEDRMNELKIAFAPLQGAVDLIAKGFDALAKVVSKGVVWALEKALDGVKWVAKALDALGAKFGKNFGLEDAFNAAAENSLKATEAEQKYIKHKRAFTEEQAKLENEIAKLRDKSLQKDKYTADERVAFLEQAMARERKISEEKKILAQENLAALEAEAARMENDTAMNDRLAEARAAVVQADTEFYNSTRRLQSQLQSFKAEVLAGEMRDLANETAAAAAANKEDEKAVAERQKKYEALVAKIKSWTQTELEALEEEYAQDIANADLTAEQKLAIEQHYQEERQRLNDEAIEAMEERNTERLNNTASEIDMWANKMSSAYSSISNAFKAVEDKDLATFEKNNKKKKADLDKRLDAGLISQEQYNAQTSQLDAELDKKKAELQDKQAKRDKALNIFSATISMATAIIKALADPGGFAGVTLSALAALTGVAQIAAIAAQPLPSQSFADGGIVKGSYDRRDNIPVNLSGGEMVINPRQQAQLFDLANGGMTSGIDYDLMAQSMAAAVAAQPAPVMDYKEFTSFQERTATYNEIARI